jgi:tetratricopeptide (TPR) repeat protein
MYRLLTNPEVIPRLYVHERTVAQAVISNYYNPHIANLEVEIAQSAPEERIALRERLQKLQVERLYYLLVRDPGEGYAEYKRLSDQANRRRWVGFSMRLLDEFLRFYNIPERRKLFETANISHNQVIRESAELWVERFYWWGQRERAAEFAWRILGQPETFAIRPGEHVAILGNIHALWTFSRAVLRGYEAEVVKESVGMLAQLPELANCNSAQALARARLLTAIGYQFRQQGQLAQAAANYVEANAAFRKLGTTHSDEWAVLLNNLAFVYAKQGRLNLAAPLAHQALQINETLGSEYSTGLTLSTLATIERMRGNYSQAVEYGEEALALFRELEDAHGTAMAYLSIAQARRRMAKHSLEIGRKLEEARQKLEAARLTLDRALDVAKEAGLGSDMLALLPEQGRVYRELGQITTRLEGFERGISYYHQSVQSLEQALALPGWAQVDRADTLQDLAEVLYELGNQSGAEKYLVEIKQLLGSDVMVSADDWSPGAAQAPEHFAPLGKVEMLRGRIAMSQGRMEEGIQHYLLAYAYFIRFSPEAVEKDILIEYLYYHLRPLSVEQQQALINSACVWGQQQKIPGVEVDLFAQTLKDLLGV